MNGHPRKYAFTEIVKDSEDPAQLMAYALYKSHKSERAVFFASEPGATEAIVEAKLKGWHDELVSDPIRLKQFRDSGESVIKALIDAANAVARQDAKQQHEQDFKMQASTYIAQITQLNADLQDASKIARQEWAEHIAKWTQQQNQPQGIKKFVINAFKWIGGSISGALGVVFVAMIIGGIVIVCADEPRKAANESLKHLVDLTLPATLVDTGVNTDDEKPLPK
ncbi:hypothetical protein ACR6A7_04440 [Pantoea sp. RRHST58]|uniref:hypothetical protein n=1 Tax=Pantoea sp. RRHST58 TaxID=3425183 RepID=UPI003DA0E3B3